MSKSIEQIRTDNERIKKVRQAEEEGRIAGEWTWALDYEPSAEIDRLLEIVGELQAERDALWSAAEFAMQALTDRKPFGVPNGEEALARLVVVVERTNRR